MSKGIYLVSLLALAAVCYYTFFYALGDYALLDPDEGRTGVIAKEMAASGNWVTLTHNGVPYYDKPAPYFWLLALGIRLFGQNEFAVRLPSALAASLMLGVVFWWGSMSGGWMRGLWSGLVLATSAEFIVLGRFGKMDMVFTFFFCGALFYFLWWQKTFPSVSVSQRHAPEIAAHSKAWIWPFYALLGLASLAKGPAGVLLPILVVGLTLGLSNRWTLLREMHILRGTAVLFLVSGPWYLWAGLEDPEYIRTFLWDHNILRFFTSRQGMDHSEPFYYFVPVLAGGFLPWSIFLPVVLHYHWEKRSDHAHMERLFLFVWFATVIVFFSLARNKLGTYILPAFPPLALLTSDFFSQFAQGGESRAWRKRWIVYAVFLWLFLILSLSPLGEMSLKYRYPHYLPIDIPLFPTVLLILLACLAWILRKEKWISWIVPFSLLWPVLWFYGEKAPQISEFRSTRSLARVVSESGAKDYRVVAIRGESLPFYLPNRVRVVSNIALVERMLEETIPTVAFIKEKHIREMQRIPPSRLFVWKTLPSARVLVTNFPYPTR